MSLRIDLASLSFLLVTAAVGACGGTTVNPGDPGRPHDDPEGTQPGGDAGSPTPGSDGGIRNADGAPGAACTSNADCRSSEQCAWPIDQDLCGETNPIGACVTPLDTPCEAETSVTGCGCNGKDVTWTAGCVGLPLNLAPTPLAHKGTCGDATPPVGPAACGSDEDCPSGQQCGYEISLACGAKAECAPIADFGGECQCLAEACGCDGTPTSISCCATFATKAVSAAPEPAAGCGS